MEHDMQHEDQQSILALLAVEPRAIHELEAQGWRTAVDAGSIDKTDTDAAPEWAWLRLMKQSGDRQVIVHWAHDFENRQDYRAVELTGAYSPGQVLDCESHFGTLTKLAHYAETELSQAARHAAEVDLARKYLGFDATRVAAANWEPALIARIDPDGLTHITAQAKSHAGSINTVLTFTRTVADGPAVLARCAAMDDVANELPVDDYTADVREAICNVRDGLVAAPTSAAEFANAAEHAWDGLSAPGVHSATDTAELRRLAERVWDTAADRLNSAVTVHSTQARGTVISAEYTNSIEVSPGASVTDVLDVLETLRVARAEQTAQQNAVARAAHCRVGIYL